MDLGAKYEKRVFIGGDLIHVWQGVEAASGRSVILHQFTEHPELLRVAVEYLLSGQREPILDCGEMDGLNCLVTVDDLELLDIGAWINYQMRQKAAAPAQASGDASPAEIRQAGVPPQPPTNDQPTGGQPTSEQPSGSKPSNEPGEFTRLFQAPGSVASSPPPVEQVPPMAAASGGGDEGLDDTVELRVQLPTRLSTQPAAHAPDQPSKRDSKPQVPSLQQNPPQAAPLPPESVQETQQQPGEFTRLFMTSPLNPAALDIPSVDIHSVDVPAADLPAAKTPRQAESPILQSPPSAEAPQSAIPGRDVNSGFSGQFPAPQFSVTSERPSPLPHNPRPAAPSAPQATPQPAAREPGEFTRLFQAPGVNADQPPARPSEPARPAGTAQPAGTAPAARQPPPLPANAPASQPGPGEFTRLFNPGKLAGQGSGAGNMPPVSRPPEQPRAQSLPQAPPHAPSQPPAREARGDTPLAGEFTRLFGPGSFSAPGAHPGQQRPQGGPGGGDPFADPFEEGARRPQPSSSAPGEYTRIFGKATPAAPSTPLPQPAAGSNPPVSAPMSPQPQPVASPQPPAGPSEYTRVIQRGGLPGPASGQPGPYPGAGPTQSGAGFVPPVQAPSVSGPNISGPNMSGPNVSGPSVSAPSVSAPSVSGPSFSGPHVSGPSVSGPNVSAPHVSAPNVSAPYVSAPHISSPQMSAPSMPAPSSAPAQGKRTIAATPLILLFAGIVLLALILVLIFVLRREPQPATPAPEQGAAESVETAPPAAGGADAK